MKKIKLLMSLFAILSLPTLAQQLSENSLLTSNRVSEEIVIDGKLNEKIWQNPPALDEYFTVFSPNNGDKDPFRTKVWFAHTDKDLYFAFYCYDDQPDNIKTSISNRDEIWGDDWIGFNIDPTGNKRYGYALFSNPYGIQADLFDTPDNGGDVAADFVWYSAGQITDKGYIVEFRLPLKSFNYRSGKEIVTNIVLERKIARLGSVSTWGDVPVGQPYFAGMQKLHYDELKYNLKAELIPEITYINNSEKTAPATWNKTDDKVEFGITGKVGITSRINMEGTYNPDFSQIETDDFQVLVNQRYPIFYSEKRPFFMEAEKIFNLAGSDLEGKSMTQQVYTRKITDPLWGLKFNGEGNGFAFGAMISDDEWPGRKFKPGLDQDSINPLEGKKASYKIARFKYGLGSANHIGAIVTNWDFASNYNRVAGLDLNYQFGEKKHWIKSNFMYSLSKDKTAGQEPEGTSFDLQYYYRSKKFQAWLNYEYLDEDFEMATAFIRRYGISKWAGMMWYNIYPKSKFLKKLTFILYGNYLSDIVTKDEDYMWKGGINFSTLKQGGLRVEYESFKEYWMDLAYTGGFLHTYGHIQLVKWLEVNGGLRYGDRINYSPPNPYLGTGTTLDFQFILQPHDKLSQSFQYRYDDLINNTNNTTEYRVNILISKTSFQLNKYLFLRANIQYDSYLETILTDALASFKLIPGTSLQLGYGSQYRNIYWENNEWNNKHPDRKYNLTNKRFYVKASYRYQF